MISGPSSSTRMKTLFVSSSDGQWKTELESREGFTETIEEDVLVRVRFLFFLTVLTIYITFNTIGSQGFIRKHLFQLLSWMEVRCLEVEASKEVAEKSSGRFYDTLNLILQWTESSFGAVSIRLAFHDQ